jgi:probable phosphoglycerate mutase
MAQQVGQTLRNLNLDACYSSPLKRAAHTAELILANLPEATRPNRQPTEKLLEIDLPEWEGMLRDEVKSQFAEAYHLWSTQPAQLEMQRSGPDGPISFFPVRSLYDQAEEFWQTTLPQHSGQTILVVAHNGIIRALVSTALGLAAENYKILRQSNCGITVLNFAGAYGDPVQLESMNLTAHVGEPIPDRHATGGVRLLLVRHGETEWNRLTRFQGQIDVPLNDNGLAQAAKVTNFLKDIKLDFAVASPLLRPKQTAEAILKHHGSIPFQLEPDLKEISHGLWEGKLEHEIAAEYGQLLREWKTKPEVVQMPEGENLQQVWDRSVASWNRILDQAPGGSVGLVVAHDAVNKAILCHVMGLQPKDFWAVKQGNCAVTVVDYPEKLNASPVLQALNITTHLSDGEIFDRTAAGAL